MTAASSVPTRNPILWGAYLACSWTWCIGMFLPALLLRDMGWAGYWIFAVPNIIGAALMGWFLKNRSSSVRFVENHAQAIWWFSAVTLAFHFYWILWFSSFMQVALGIPVSYLMGSIGIFCVFVLISSWTTRLGKAPQTALALLVFSLFVLIGTTCTTDLREASVALFDSTQQPVVTLWMLPVMLFGFLLCPYLDITFHHARQQLDSKKNGQLGFTIGFVGFFSFMILLTTRYAGVIVGALNGSELPPIVPWLASGILIHILCQWFFTVRVHLDRIHQVSDEKRKRSLLIVLLAFAGIAGILAPRLPEYAGLAGGEIIYRLFMSAYGLVFPAYMLYRVIARKANTPAMWGAIVLALPFFWMGFIERHTIWLVPGMALILLGAIVQLKKHA